MTKLAYRIDDAAEVVGFSRSTLYKDIQSGDLKTICRGRSRRITHAALQAYLKVLQRRSSAPAETVSAQQNNKLRSSGKAVR